MLHPSVSPDHFKLCRRIQVGKSLEHIVSHSHPHLQALGGQGEQAIAALLACAGLHMWVQDHDLGGCAIESAALMQRLAAERMPLTVCPLSNVKLCVYPHMSQHQLPALLDAGLVCTINSDDPAYFGGYMNANWLATFEALPQLSLAHARTLALNSFEASFVDEATKAGWRRKLDEVLARSV